MTPQELRTRGRELRLRIQDLLDPLYPGEAKEVLFDFKDLIEEAAIEAETYGRYKKYWPDGSLVMTKGRRCWTIPDKRNLMDGSKQIQS